jgi:hypothetical protein
VDSGTEPLLGRETPPEDHLVMLKENVFEIDLMLDGADESRVTKALWM